MKVSVNWMQWYGDTPLATEGISELVERIGAQLGAVEEVVALGERYKDVLIVKVVSCQDHPQADRLHVCKIDDGGKASDVARDENGMVQVVCGAPNVREGMFVAWLPPGATVPSTYGSQDPFVLEARALRGVVSNGMLASAKELGIGDSHEGIMELSPNDGEPGTPFSDAYGLDDYILDIENKMFTHRPDCFGQLGVAREVAGIQHTAFVSPDWYTLQPPQLQPETDELKLEVKNEIPELVPRFTAITMRNVSGRHSSPVWLQTYLARVGIRPINAVVDLTNYYMVLTGQPLHAYDYDKVVAQDTDAPHATIVVRHPREGEKITLLSGKEITPRAEAIMIATNDRLIGVGGIMGGVDTEVDENTQNIIIECANFDMYSVRRTSMAHGLFTDAVTRFNKGQSPLQTLAVLTKIVADIKEYVGGQVAGQVIDDNHMDTQVMQQGSLHAPVTVEVDFINARLGLDLDAEAMAELLRNVEFVVDVSGKTLTVTAPFWRTDIAIGEDIVEEVGRLYGFDHLPVELPVRDLTPAARNPMLDLKARTRRILSQAGANELLTYSFVHGNLLQKAGQDSEQAFRIGNALSPDLQYFRLTLTPSLLDKVHPNLKAGYESFAVFEMGKTRTLIHANDDEGGVPQEFDSVAFVCTENDKLVGHEGAAYYQARTYLDYLAQSLGIELVYTPCGQSSTSDAVTQPFDCDRAAYVTVRGADGVVLGIVGEFRNAVRAAFKLPMHTAGFEMRLDGLLATAANGYRYMQMPRFPKLMQDITLRVSADTPFARIDDLLHERIKSLAAAKEARVSLQLLDIYQADGADSKNFTFRVTVASYERTLTDGEVSAMLSDLASAAYDVVGAERI